MALQTQHLVNGQWITRNMDIHRIIAANRQKVENRPAPQLRRNDEPVFGILSRPVMRSPVINSIIPARIRHKLKNDIVFVGEDFVHVKEILDDGHLRHVGTKTGFNSRIRTVGVFGEQLKAHDPRIKVEEVETTPYGEFPMIVPPQLLVLALESNEFVFLFAHQHPNGSLGFRQSAFHPLPPMTSFLEQPGRLLAVDPKSRAIAVAACDGFLIVFKCKTAQEVQSNYTNNPTEWTPVSGERAIQVRGTILKMEFLYPAADDGDHVVLVVIHSYQRRTKISCFDWDYSESLASIRTCVQGQNLSPDERHPTLLIPLQHSSNFILVDECGASFRTNILSGEVGKHSFYLADEEQPRYPGNSSRLPLWTSWTRAVRNYNWNDARDEAFYLVREDGVVLYVQVSASLTATASRAGYFGCSVNTAFASYEVWRDTLKLDMPDFLIAAGDMSTGEIVKIGAWRDEDFSLHNRGRAFVMEIDYLEPIPNWSPTMDMIISNFSSSPGADISQRKGIFATAGRTPHGAIVNLRHGVEARLGITFPAPELAGATGLWALEDRSGTGIFFLITLPPQTLLLRIPKDASEVEGDFDEATCGVDLNNETIAAGMISVNKIAQVTTRAVLILDPANADVALHRDFALELPEDSSIVAAAITLPMSTLATAVRKGGNTAFQLLTLDEATDETTLATVDTSIPLSSDPTYFQFFEIRGIVYLFLALTDTSVQLLKLLSSGRLVAMFESKSEPTLSRSLSAPCASVALLASPPIKDLQPETEYAIICGLRNGHLCTIKLRFVEKNGFRDAGLAPEPIKVITMGPTAVQVIPDPGGSDIVAFAICGSDLCRLRYNGLHAGLSVNNVWFTDRNQPELQQGSVSALARLPHYRSNNGQENGQGKGLSGALACISGQNFSLAQLDDEVRPVARRIDVIGTPNRLLYCTRLNVLIIASTRTELRKSGQGTPRQRNSVRRVNQAIIQFLAPTANSDSEETLNIKGIFEDLWPGERVYVLLDWICKDSKGNTYGFLIVGTGIMTEEGTQNGRVMFLQTRLDDQGNVSSKLSKEMGFHAPVYAIAAYGDNDLIISSGNSLNIHRFSPETKKWSRVCVHEMSSPAVHITTSPPHIYTTTAEDSLQTFIFRDDPQQPLSKPRLELFYSDSQSRQALHHLPLTLPISSNASNTPGEPSQAASQTDEAATMDVVLVSDKACSVTGLIIPKVRRHQSAAPTLFEASLPRSIARLRRGRISPPWRSRVIAGIITDDIIGTSVDGSVFAFSVVDEKAWRLLKFLENICKRWFEWHLRAYGRGYETGRTLDPDKDIVGLKNKTAYHVDGDVLGTILEHVSAMGTMLRQVVTETEGEDVEVTESELMGKLKELVHGVLGECGSSTQGVWDQAVEWLREVLTVL